MAKTTKKTKKSSTATKAPSTRRRALLKDVAKMAQCSNATVSRVMHSPGIVRPEVRKAVQGAIKKLGYIPPEREKSKDSGTDQSVHKFSVLLIVYRSGMVEDVELGEGGIQVSDSKNDAQKSASDVPGGAIGSSFYSSLIDGAAGEALRWNCRLEVEHRTSLIDDDFFKHISSTYQGIILAGEYGDEIKTFIRKCPMPLVLLDLEYSSMAPLVISDSRSGMEQACAHLWERGHRSIGCIAGDVDKVVSYNERYQTYLSFLAGRDIDYISEWVYRGPHQIYAVREWCRELFATGKSPTAFVCCNDWAAMGLLEEAHDAGVAVPEELSVVGYDDAEVAIHCDPPLTTVRVPTVDMGRHAARQLLAGLSVGLVVGSTRPTILLQPEIVYRNSTASRPT